MWLVEMFCSDFTQENDKKYGAVLVFQKKTLGNPIPQGNIMKPVYLNYIWTSNQSIWFRIF